MGGGAQGRTAEAGYACARARQRTYNVGDLGAHGGLHGGAELGQLALERLSDVDIVGAGVNKGYDVEQRALGWEGGRGELRRS